MLRKLTVMGTIVLFVATGALGMGGGAARQNTVFDASIGNAVWRKDSQGLSVGVNAAFVGLHQNGQVGRRGYFEQNTMALLGQAAVEWGRGGMMQASQTADTEGEQTSIVGSPRGRGGISQSQGSSTSLGQYVRKVGGSGGVVGMNVGIVSLNQGTASRAGIGAQRQITLIGQGALVEGGPGSTGIVEQHATVNATQSQNF
jgi:hypothetical protein